MFANPDLGKTLRLIAERGRDAYYRGEIAQSIMSYVVGPGRNHAGG